MAARDSIRKKPKDTRGTFIRLIAYIGRYKWILMLVFALCFTSNVLALLGPSLAGSAINEAAAGAGKVNFDRVFYFAFRMLFCYVVSSVKRFTYKLIRLW